MLDADKIRHRLYLAAGLLTALVPVVYFHNGIVTEYYYSKAVWVNFLAPALLVGWLLTGLRQGKLILPKSRVLLPLFALLTWCLLSLIWVRNPNKAWDLIVIVGAGPFLGLAIATFAERREQIVDLLYLILLAASAVAIYGFVQYFEVVYLPKDQYGDADPSTTIGLTNFAVEYMSLFFLAGPLLLLGERRRWLRSLLIVASICIITYLLISRNRAAFLALVAELAALLVLLLIAARWRANKTLISGRVVAMIAAAMVAGAASVFTQTTVGERVAERFVDLVKVERVDDQTSLLSALLERAQRDASVRFRLQTWYQCLLGLFPAHPLYGVGLANAEIEFPRHFTEFLEGMTVRHNTRVVHLHNEYVQALSDLGVIGLTLLAWLFVQLFRSAYAGFRRIRDRRQLLLWLAVHVGFFGYMVEMFFAFPLQIPTSSIYFFVFLGLSIAVNRHLRHADGGGENAFFVLSTSSAAVRRGAYLAIALLLCWGGYNEVLAYQRLIAEVRNKEARVFRRASRLPEAERLLDEAIARYPGMEGYYFDRGSIRLQSKNAAGALADFKETAKLVPNYAAGRKQIGMLAAQAGQTELAVQEFKVVMDIYKSQRVELAELIAKVALQGNRPELAVPVLETTLEKAGYASGLAPALFQAYLQTGNAVKGIELVERYPDLAKSDLGIRVNYISSLFLAGRQAEAAKLALDFRAQHPELAEAWLLAAKAEAAGDVLASQQSIKKALALNPKLRDAVKRDPGFKSNPALAEFIKQL